jgi:inner membrane protein
MDSITQIALGAAVGEAVAGKQVGRRALLWGGFFGLLPDLDILISYGDAVRDVTYHRSWSHSALVMTAMTPLWTWLICKLQPATRAHWRRMLALVFLALITHTLLDCFTVYGTQILWPLPMAPVGWSTIFIIDPAYSLPLMLGIGAAWYFHKRSPRRAARLNAIALALSCLYLGWSVGAKLIVERAVRAELSARGVAYERLLTTPAPFNTLLWRVVVMTPDEYREGYYSLVSGGGQPRFTQHPAHHELLAPVADAWAVQRLGWFTRGFIAATHEDGKLVLTDLRMGSEPNYVFRYVVAEGKRDRLHPVPPRRFDYPDFGREQLAWLWRRTWDATADADRLVAR